MSASGAKGAMTMRVFMGLLLSRGYHDFFDAVRSSWLGRSSLSATL